MDTPEFYAQLKKEDRERVEAVVAAFKSDGLEVLARTDSDRFSFQKSTSTYVQIGLTVAPPASMTVGDVRRSVEDVVRQFHGQEVREAVPESLRGSVLLDSYIRVDNPPFSTPAEKDATKKVLEEFIKPMTEKRIDYKIYKLNPPIKNFSKEFKPMNRYNTLPIITSPPIDEKNYENYRGTNPDDSRMTSLSEEVEHLDRYLDKEVERLRREFGLKEKTSYNGKYPPIDPTFLGKFKESEPLNKIPHEDKLDPYSESLRMINDAFFGSFVPSKNPTVTREQQYRIGTIGETPIDVRVHYQPLDGIGRLMKTEL